MNDFLKPLIIVFGLMFAVLVLAIGWVVIYETFFSLSSLAGQKNRYKIKKAINKFNLNFYTALYVFPLTHVFIINLVIMFQRMYVLDDDEARGKATSVVLLTVATGIATTLIGLRYYDDTLLAVITSFMFVLYVFQKLRGDGQKFLSGLEDSIEDMVHMYNSCGGNIDKMFTILLEDKANPIHRYIDQMYFYLKQAVLYTNDSKYIDEYNSLVASRHLRLIFNYLYITYQYGDNVNANGENLFNRNMLAIQREIHADCSKLTYLKDATMGEQWFIIIGVAMIPLANNYMVKYFTFENFEAISRFLNSSLGYGAKVISGVFAMICFYIYSKIMLADSGLEYYKEIVWEEKFVNRSVKLGKFLNKLAPKEGSKRRIRLETDIAVAEGHLGLKILYLRKLVIATLTTLALVIFLSLDTFSTYNAILGDLYRGVNPELMTTVVSLQENPDQYMAKSLSNDVLVMDIIDDNKVEYFELTLTSEREEFIMDIIRDNEIDYGVYYEIAAQRIVEKYVQINKIDPFVLVMLVLITFIGAYNIPNLAIKLKVKLSQGVIIYDEVVGCYTVVILLINHPVANIQMILKWLCSFTFVFKDRLQSCVDNYSVESIKELNKGIDYKPFNRLVESIMLSYEGIDLKAAFAGIEQRHLFQEESRNAKNALLLGKRIKASSSLSWMPITVTFLLYIMVPMVLAISEMLFQLN